MKGKYEHLLILTKYLLAMIFCGVIIGETLSLTMVVTTFGAGAVGRMYLVNALLLLSFPIFFFRYIDAVNRGKLLANALLIISIVVVASSVVYQIFSWGSLVVRFVTVILYPVSYISKTLLFLTFWTYLNDIYTIQDAKKHFPVIAAWGFCGAIVGVVLGRILLAMFAIQHVMGLWAAVFIGAWFISGKLRYGVLKKEAPQKINENKKEGFAGVTQLIKNRLIVIIAFIYFGTFLTIFTMDFLFWRHCSEWLNTAEKIASFQFMFYIVHATVTVMLLRFVLPRVIDSIGFTRVMYGLPLLFMVTGSMIIIIEKQSAESNTLIIATIIQFFRQVLFELTFATSYQMLFVVIVRELRGRAKTLLEGVVKPVAIFASGIAIVLAGSGKYYIAGIIVGMGLALFLVIYYLRLVYIKTIMEKISPHLEMNEVINIAGKNESAAFYRIVKEYADSDYEDMKVLAVHLLKKAGTPYSFNYLVEIYKKEPVQRVKELIARSIKIFYSYRTRSFAEYLLKEKNNRIRANAISAINNMQCNWKKHLKPLIAPFLFENDQRVQIEAAVFLWNHGTGYERNTVLQFLDSLTESNVPNRQAAGIYLTGLIRVEGWDTTLLENMSGTTMQVFTKSMEILFKNGAEKSRKEALHKAEVLSRRHLTVTGKIIERDCLDMAKTLMAFIPEIEDRRMMFEVMKALNKAADSFRLSGRPFNVDKNTVGCIRRWILGELKTAYMDAVHFSLLRSDIETDKLEVLDLALRERYLRLCNWAIGAMVLTDTKGIFVRRTVDMDVNEKQTRQDVIEILESMPQEKIGTLVLPLLKDVDWEILSKMAKIYFHFGKWELEDGFAYFLQAENRFVVLSTLYCIELNLFEYRERAGLKESLTMLKKNDDERIAAAASTILKSDRNSYDKHSRAFDLLDRVLFFKKCFLFHNIGAEKLLRVVELAQIISLKENDVVSAVGRLNDKVFIVKTGKLRIEKEGHIEKIIGKGETYGEEGLFANIIQSTTITAEEPSEVYVLKKADIRRLIRELPDIALNFLEAITSKLLKQQGELTGNKDSYSREESSII